MRKGISAAALAAVLAAACSRGEAPKRYELTGQVLAVDGGLHEAFLR